MQWNPERIDPTEGVLVALGLALAAVAVANYLSGVYGGAIVAAIGSAVTMTLMLLVGR